MLVPTAVVKLDESHAALGQPSRQKAIRRVRSRLARIISVKLIGRVGFLREVRELRHGRLHTIRHFVLGYACFNLRITVLVGQHAVELRNSVQHAAARDR